MPWLYVKISWLYLFTTYTRILQTSLEDSKGQANIHGVEKHEAGGNKEGGGLLWADSKVGSWFTSTTHKQFLNYCV